ncbi:MAG: transcription termination factor Rho [Lachnospiraceae bacterium]|nr:transcription termination factor Rho [Lachnospiraceae bacterium]
MENYDELSLVELRVAGRKLGLKNVTTFRKTELLKLVKEAAENQSRDGAEQAETKSSKDREKKTEEERSAGKRGKSRRAEETDAAASESQEKMVSGENRSLWKEQEERPEKSTEESDRDKREAYNKKAMMKYGDKQHREVREVRDNRDSGVKREFAGREREYPGKRMEKSFSYTPTEIQQLDSGETRRGILEVMSEGYGFIRCDNYLPGDEDVYVSPAMIRKYQLRTGDILEGHIRIRNQNEKFAALLYITTVNGVPLSEAVKRPKFERLTPIFPDERIRLETPGSSVSMRMMDLVAPIGKGQRGMIVSQPKTGKTTLLKQVAKAVKTNHPKMHLIVLLIDERPEEVTDIKESIMGHNVEVIYSTFDELPENHKRVSEMVIERAKRLVEHGEDVMILLDSITRLARAYNLTVSPSGRTLSGGLDPAALHMPKRFFGAARNMREGGSLTILATALVDTGSKMDDVVFEEFKGTGNMELVLDRKLSEKRVFPAIDLPKSSTRREDLLMTQEEIEATYLMRKAFNGTKSEEAVEHIIDMFRKTKNNQEFIQLVKKVKIV